ncbi:hypothetical protein [Jannaschia sp. 2305UL9-9]
MAFPTFRRTRGINFLLGGILVACVFIAFSLLGGDFDLGMGAPEVHIEGQ